MDGNPEDHAHNHPAAEKQERPQCVDAIDLLPKPWPFVLGVFAFLAPISLVSLVLPTR